MNNWGKEYNKMAEENEFYGLPYDDNTDKLIKQFISDLRKKDMEELMNKLEELSPAYEGEALDTNNNRRWYEQGFGEHKKEVKQLIQDYYNKSN
jgi:ribosomal protein L12E/L44/L45/RPP1/RPP2